ncbi:uncharacterized protein FIBRA_00850 [Fibroporia radiculosa]|uniref:Cofilin n=1 Tax=Fibroporia radiculosa TaxID=599839 RepID=J4H0S2_9APHY|nr:uncharacterized protein FIBRA_00850 [Fibroporia radiculosa]CCL98844.1 predicted protein [Fibroporia radiculosa]
MVCIVLSTIDPCLIAQSRPSRASAALQASQSGVGVSPDCLSAYQNLKLGKKIKYIVFTLNSTNTEIIVEKESQSNDYDEFLSNLPETEPRWAVYDFEYEKEGAGKRNKITFFSWSPDDSKIKQKMLFASSKDALRRSLVGIAAEIQGTDYSEVAYESVLDKVSRGA